MTKWYTGTIREPLLPGLKLNLAGQELILPPFNIRRTRDSIAPRDVLKRSGGMNVDVVNAMAEIACIGLSANYPDMTADLILDSLQFEDLTTIFAAQSKVNGVKAGEA